MNLHDWWLQRKSPTWVAVCWRARGWHIQWVFASSTSCITCLQWRPLSVTGHCCGHFNCPSVAELRGAVGGDPVSAVAGSDDRGGVGVKATSFGSLVGDCVRARSSSSGSTQWLFVRFLRVLERSKPGVPGPGVGPDVAAVRVVCSMRAALELIGGSENCRMRRLTVPPWGVSPAGLSSSLLCPGVVGLSSRFKRENTPCPLGVFASD